MYESFVLGLEEEFEKSKQSGDACQGGGMTPAELSVRDQGGGQPSCCFGE